MPRWLQILLHLVTVGTGSFLAYKTGTPVPLVVSGAVNTAIGGIAQLYNTDGTPQSVPYIPPSDKLIVK